MVESVQTHVEHLFHGVHLGLTVLREKESVQKRPHLE